MGIVVWAKLRGGVQMRVLLAALLMAAIPIHGAEPKALKGPPHFGLTGTDTGTGVMSMECKGDPPYALISCDFVQVGIRRDSEKEFEKERAELKEQLAKTSEADLLKQVSAVREAAKKTDGVLRTNASTLVPEKLQYLRESFVLLQAVAACTAKPCIVDALLKQQAGERNSCKVSTHTFSSEFQRVGPNKWVSNPGPQGICNIVYVQTLENEKDSSGLWTFTQTNVTADKGGLCEGIELNKPSIFSWRSQTELIMDCHVIEFSAF